MLSLWEGWCVFPQESQEHFVTMFNNPPLSAKDQEEAREKEAAAAAEKGKSKWKTVEETAKETPEIEEEVDGEPMEEDVDGEPMDDEDVDGVPMEDDDVDGLPMEEDIDGEPTLDEPAPIALAPEVKPSEAQKPEPAGGQVRRRPKAVDMFADSDEEDQPQRQQFNNINILNRFQAFAEEWYAKHRAGVESDPKLKLSVGFPGCF